MSLGSGLGIGQRALRAARLAMETAGQNVANANTPGYSRQQALLSSTAPTLAGQLLQLGTGVSVDTIRRIVDERLDARLRTQTSLFGQADVEYSRLRQIEGVLGEGDASGLSQLLPDFFGAVGQLKTDSRDGALRGSVVQAGRGLTDEFRLISSRLEELRTGTFPEVEGVVADVNQLAEGISRLNAGILSVEVGGQQANDLRDQREELQRQLSELIDVRGIERQNGSVDVLVGGRLLVSGERSNALVARKDATGLTEVGFAGSAPPVALTGGKLAGLVATSNVNIPGLTSKLDLLARNLILEVNRIHSTGVPASGSFSSLISDRRVRDGNGNGQFADEPLKTSGFPFAMQKGDLYLTVTDKVTGASERTKIAVDPETMTFGELAAGIDGADHVSAAIDSTGALRIDADGGFGFNFSLGLDSAPDSIGSFGGANAVVGGNNAGPFAFTFPATFTVAVDGGAAQTVTLQSSSFPNPTGAKPAEVAAAINAQLTGARVKVVGDRVVVQSLSSGTLSSLLLTDGAGGPLATLGLRAGLPFTGSALPVQVSVSGKYTGTSNDQFRFVAEGNGQIGVTPALKVGVFDKAGTKVAVLDVGQGYSPGDKLAVTAGITVSFGPGAISADAKHQFVLDTLADSDSADVLVALGLNSFFTGSTASDIAVSARIEADPDLLSAGLTGAAGDGDNLERLLDLRKILVPSLGNQTLEAFQGGIVTGVGFSGQRARALADSQQSMLQFLEDQRQEISGVSIDEEVVDLVRFQQSFQAAARLINTINDMNQTLIDMAR